METIVTVTLNPALDKSVNVERVVPERKLRCDSVRYDPGGGGINVARALCRLGSSSTAIFFAGGPTGTLLEERVTAEGVEIVPVPIEDWTRENLTVLEETTLLQYRFGMPGPRIRDDEWRAMLDSIDRLDPAPGYLVASGSLPQGAPDDVYAQIARAATERGVRMVVDTSGEALREAVAGGGIYLLKPNLAELASLVGEEWITDETHLDEVASGLVEGGGCEVVVVSLGGRGAYVVTATERARIPAPAVPIQSKVGAGDTMVAGIVHGLVRGMPVIEAARFGVAAGAATVMSPGTGLCAREDVERLYEHARSEHTREIAGQPLGES